MLHQFLSYLKEGNTFNSFEIFSTEENVVLNFSSYKKRREGLELETTQEVDIADFESLAISDKKSFLIINTNDVITKIVTSDDDGDEMILHKAFPNLKIQDFYYEITKWGNSNIISICRRSLVIKYLDLCKENGFSISGLSIGVSNISILFPFVQKNVIHIRNKALTIDRQDQTVHISTITMDPNQSYDISGMTLTSKQLLGFGNILIYIQNNNTQKSNFYEVNSKLKEESQHQRIYKLFFKIGILILLLLLVINFLFFNYYYSKTEDLKQAQQVNTQNKSRIIELTELVNTKERMIEDVISSSSSKVSFYTDAITYSMPKTVLLNEMNFQPLLKDIKENKELVYIKKLIIVSGVSTDSKVFSTWLEALEDFNWIEKIDITAYDYTEQDASIFSLKIYMSDEE